MHRLILVSAFLAIVTLVGCTPCSPSTCANGPYDGNYDADMSRRHNPVGTAGW
jgi:hypothetical protein